jgi:hypothetical protein
VQQLAPEWAEIRAIAEAAGIDGNEFSADAQLPRREQEETGVDVAGLNSCVAEVSPACGLAMNLAIRRIHDHAVKGFLILREKRCLRAGPVSKIVDAPNLAFKSDVHAGAGLLTQPKRLLEQVRERWIDLISTPGARPWRALPSEHPRHDRRRQGTDARSRVEESNLLPTDQEH